MSGLIGFATMSGNTERIAGYIGDATVSYTHLTLPTIE